MTQVFWQGLGHADNGDMPRSLLLVEDDDTIRETIHEALSQEGFRITAFANGQDALLRLQDDHSSPFDLVVLDLMLPGLDGLELCRRLRQSGDQIPILVVSARDSEGDRVRGLDVGADDYLIKPFGIRELVARCRALLRRSSAGSDAPPPCLEHANLCLYPEECRVTRDGVEVNLSPKEYRLLELFMQHPRRVWSRDKLLNHIWGENYFGDSKTVDVHIRWLREKLEANPSAPVHLTTVRGFGYRFG
ncbi:MAG: response regulator transcription factor [Synechococcaceae cyanobacterium]|nr:response regulator transcription factor [Synechococcaceae cyanobacterium]